VRFIKTAAMNGLFWHPAKKHRGNPFSTRT